MLGDEPRYWALIGRMNYPAFPIGHPYREREQAIRFGTAEDGPKASAADLIRSLAILPFDNLKQDEEIDWLSEAMAEAEGTAITGRLPCRVCNSL